METQLEFIEGLIKNAEDAIKAGAILTDRENQQIGELKGLRDVIRAQLGKPPAAEVKEVGGVLMARMPFWDDGEIGILRRHYNSMRKEQLQSLLPKRTWSAIMSKSWKLGLRRPNFGLLEWRRMLRAKPIQLNEDSAYVLGVLCGDGSVEIQEGRPYVLSLTVEDYDFALNFTRALEKAFEKKPSIVPKDDGWRVRLSSIRVGEWVYQVLGTTKSYSWQVGDAIFNASESVKCAFLKGLYDSEGTIGHDGITIYSVNLKGLEQIKELLSSLGISSAGIGSLTSGFGSIIHRFSIHRRASLITFVREIGFSIQRKKESLLKLAGGS